MKIACPKCGREYRLDPSRIPAKGARFTCWGCQAKVEGRPLQTGQLEAPTGAGEALKKELASQSAAAASPAMASASPAPASKAQAPAQKVGTTGPLEEEADGENFITGPGLQVVKSILSPKAKGA